ncbi:16S rRNA (uracil(1498)-N(3))-methyltransferase [Alkalicoccus chagannorensis]|uniref:16S rRNA (uracil(1498)-N(3))-methyltransferase n=1 Tax=Alkalicoccus chagannorensis TaxID=427072 RepID=UPI00041122C9|nr:16S rRNA (uracil(1498)-N(3))-methyltransferase [Alkalicoccus chagannorensis]
MQRYFLDGPLEDSTSAVLLDKEAAHHAVKVMRGAPGDEMIVCFSSGCWHAVLAETDPATVHLLQQEKETNEMPIRVTIAHGLPKADKLEMVLQKGTELGAASFLPFAAERSVVKWNKQKGEKKVERWRKIVKEAAEQSHRHTLPSVHEPCSFSSLLDQCSQFDVVITAYEETAKQGERGLLKRRFEDILPGASVLFIVGPEGGFSEQEAASLKNAGILCSLGPRILRTETAPLAFLSAVSFYFE